MGVRGGGGLQQGFSMPVTVPVNPSSVYSDPGEDDNPWKVLAPTGALIVMLVYYIYIRAATFSDFHSVHWCNWWHKCHSKSLKQYQCNWCHKMLGISWGYLGFILVIYWGYLGDILGTSWEYLGEILGISWGYLGDILGVSWGYLGDLLDHCPSLNVK